MLIVDQRMLTQIFKEFIENVKHSISMDLECTQLYRQVHYDKASVWRVSNFCPNTTKHCHLVMWVLETV